MPAFIWNTNHRMWKVVPPFTDSFDVLKAYICDPCAYVYWSTPRFQDEIQAGDIAYILRTADESGRDGIVARGRVEETPRQLMKAIAQPVRVPGAPDACRLGRAGRALVLEDRDPDRGHVLGRPDQGRAAGGRDCGKAERGAGDGDREGRS